jgi:hypothetical protein
MENTYQYAQIVFQILIKVLPLYLLPVHLPAWLNGLSSNSVLSLLEKFPFMLIHIPIDFQYVIVMALNSLGQLLSI